MEKSNRASGGIGFFGALQIVFIVLKLTHVIDWSWVWVLAPAWIEVIVTVIVFGCCFAFERKMKRVRKIEKRRAGDEDI